MRHRRSFSVSPESLREARSFVADLLRGASLEILEVVAVMVSELVTNAQLHAATDFEVVADYSMADRRLRVEIIDTGAGEPTVRRPKPTDPHGRGLQIVAMLSDEWGIDRPSGEPGKRVWFEISVPSANPGEEGDAVRRAAAREARSSEVAPAGPPVHSSPTVALAANAEPDLSAPDVSAPDVSAPDVSAPDVSAPDVSAPDVSAPDVSAPDLSAPDLSAPDLSAPDLSAPDLSAPDLSAPDVSGSRIALLTHRVERGYLRRCRP